MTERTILLVLFFGIPVPLMWVMCFVGMTDSPVIARIGMAIFMNAVYIPFIYFRNFWTERK